MAHDEMDAATHIDVEAEVRYWEDAVVGGVADEDGTLIPGRSGDAWNVRIDLTTGIVANWPLGTIAQIHYKVCDQGEYWLSDADGRRIAKWRGSYVPDDFLCHPGDGFGDYIILDVDGEGRIRDYRRPKIDPTQWDMLQ